MRRRGRSRGPAILAAGAVTAAAAAAAALWARRQEQPRAALAGLRDRVTPAAMRKPETARRPWSCQCGKAYEVTGTDRHRIYWEKGAPESEPVLGSECVQCGRPLPREHETEPVTVPPA